MTIVSWSLISIHWLRLTTGNVALVLSKSPPRPSGGSKLQRLLGDEYAEKVAADLRPWYLRPNYSPSEILIEPDNSIKGGTVPALVERLTAHEQAGKSNFLVYSYVHSLTYASSRSHLHQSLLNDLQIIYNTG
jgi:hypothetical protein